MLRSNVTVSYILSGDALIKWEKSLREKSWLINLKKLADYFQVCTLPVLLHSILLVFQLFVYQTKVIFPGFFSTYRRFSNQNIQALRFYDNFSLNIFVLINQFFLMTQTSVNVPAQLLI